MLYCCFLVPPSGNLCTPIHITAGSQHCHVAAWGICIWMFAVSQGHYMAAYTHLFACMQCTNIDMWQPGGTHLHTIHLQGPACDMSVCTPAPSQSCHLGYIPVLTLAVYWNLQMVASHYCFQAPCAPGTKHGNLNISLKNLHCPSTTIWLPVCMLSMSQGHHMAAWACLFICLHIKALPGSGQILPVYTCHVSVQPSGSLGTLLVHLHVCPNATKW